MNRFYRTKKGVIDVPFELLLIVFILAIVLPLIYGLYTLYSQQQEMEQLTNQINMIGATVIEVFDGGINTTIILTVTLPKDTQKVAVGNDPSNPLSDMIGYKIFNQWFYYKVNNGATDIPMSNTTTTKPVTYQPFIFSSSITLILRKAVYNEGSNSILYVNVGTYTSSGG